MSRKSNRAEKKQPLKTTIGELSAALFDAALAEYGNVHIARRVAAVALKDMLSRAPRAGLKNQLAFSAA